MEHGGSYERDAAIGGYDRKELRGLGKQARSGTLTQRERARYKYLKDERGGRRKRGLLAGLGGVGATLAGLAASGKLGGGGGEGGSALMDAIKGRLAKGKGNLQDKLELARDKKWAKQQGVDPREYNDEEKKAVEKVPERDEFGRTFAEQMREEGEGYTSEKMRIADELARNVDSRKVGKETRGTDERDLSGELSEELGEGDLSRISEAGAPAQDFSGELSDDVGEGDLYEALEMARNNASRVSSENPLPTGITSTQRNTGSEVDLGGMLTQEELDAENALPGRIGEEPTRGSDRPNVSQLFDALNRSKASEINVDPEGLIQSSEPGAAQTMLNTYNDIRREKGLEPAIQLSKEMMQETDDAKGAGGMRYLKGKQPGQIQTNRPEKNLPQLEASEQLRHFFGNRYN